MIRNIFLLFVGLICSIFSTAQTKRPIIHTDTIYSRDLPANFEDYKIVFLTDIHYGPFMSKKNLGKIVRKVNHTNPDLILLGGDYVYLSKKYFSTCFDSLHLLKAKQGTFGVLGNHDHWEDAELCLERMNNAQIKNISNQAYWIRKGDQKIRIGGIDDLWEGRQIIDSTVAVVKHDDFVILVSHNPDYIEYIKSKKVDLILAGHTHGGQIRFFGWAPFVPSRFNHKYISGKYEKSSIQMIVSNGLGKIIIPIRIGAPAEINQIILKQKSRP